MSGMRFDSAVTSDGMRSTQRIRLFRSPVSETAWLSRPRRLADSNRWKIPLPLAQPCDPELGYRLASLADGEGCFSIARRRKNGRVTHSCSFAVKMRADDRPFLEMWHERLGMGRIHGAPAYPDAVRRNRPSVSWVVSRNDECLRLVEIFEAFPLWSKKVRDFEVWAEAVRYQADPTTTPRVGRGRQTWVEQGPLEDCHARLCALREYAA